MQRNISRISPAQYQKGLDTLQENFVTWLQKQSTWLTREQIFKVSEAPTARVILALKCVEHDSRVAIFRKDGMTWYRAANSVPIPYPATGS